MQGAGVGQDFSPAKRGDRTVGGKDLIVIGQKSGVGWALDPARQGAVVWQYRAGKGASINGPGPVVVGGMLFINSGYGALGGRPGNVLLAFGVDSTVRQHLVIG